MNGEELWQSVCAAARERGLEPCDVQRIVLAPLNRGGAGWKFWQPYKTTPALHDWLMLTLHQSAARQKKGEPVAGELVVVEQDREYLPALTIEGAVRRHQMLREFVSKLMQPVADYGKIPGSDKNTLLKPGAEKLCTFFGLRKKLEIIKEVEDWTGKDHAGEPFFYYMYRVHLYRGETLIASGDGSSNSWEKKYRWRTADRACPECGAAAIKRSKFPPRENPDAQPGWYCFNKAGGCGANFDFDDPGIADQKGGKVPNPDVADFVNTIQKMALKRALVAATLLGVNASDYFTQDVEDGYDEQSPEAAAPSRQEKPAPAKREPAPKPAAPEFPKTSAELHERLEQFDKRLQEAGLCSAGALLAHIQRVVLGEKLGDSIREIAPAYFQRVIDTAKGFEFQLREAKANAPAEEVPS